MHVRDAILFASVCNKYSGFIFRNKNMKIKNFLLNWQLFLSIYLNIKAIIKEIKNNNR